MQRSPQCAREWREGEGLLSDVACTDCAEAWRTWAIFTDESWRIIRDDPDAGEA